MSDYIFPKLKGEGIEIWKQPEFKTSLFEPMSGVEARTMRRQYPRWSFGLPIQFLLDNQYVSDLSAVMQFFIRHKGRGESFLYEDSQGFSADNSVSESIIGTGNGIKTEFQLLRSWPVLSEPVNNPDFNNLAIYIDNGAGRTLVAPSAYSVSATGLVTFSTPPDSGVTVTWDGKYYYRVRFIDDQYKFVQSSKYHHTCDDLQFVGSIRNIV